MNIKKLNKILTILDVVNIDKVCMTKTGDNILMSGWDEKRTVLVFQDMPNEDLIEDTIAVGNVSVLLKSIGLFDIDKIKTINTHAETFIRSIDLKEGRKKVTYGLSNPAKLKVPTSVSFDEIVNEVVLTKDMVESITRAISATETKNLFTLRGEDSDIILELSDGFASFEEPIGTNNTGTWSYNWRVDKLMKLVKHAMKDRDEVVIQIGSKGIMRIEIDGIIMILARQIKR